VSRSRTSAVFVAGYLAAGESCEAAGSFSKFGGAKEVRGRAGLARVARALRPAVSLPQSTSELRQACSSPERTGRQIDELAKLDPACHFTSPYPSLYPHPHPARDHDNRLLITIKGEAISGYRALQPCSFSFVGWLSSNTLIPPLSFCPYWRQAGHKTNNNRHFTYNSVVASRPYLYRLFLPSPGSSNTAPQHSSFWSQL
jgi:hypothetical protein